MSVKNRVCLRFLLIFCLLFLLPAAAVQAQEADLYRESGAEDLMRALPEETQKLLENAGASVQTAQPDAVSNLISALAEGFRASWTAPARGLCMLVCVCVLCRFLSEFTSETAYISAFCGALCAAAILLPAAAGLLEKSGRVLTAVSAFLLAAVPVYVGLLAAGGNVVTAPSYGAIALMAANGISALTGAVLMPVLRVFLTLSAMTAVTSFELKKLICALYKGIKWALVFAVTIYAGVLSVQTIITGRPEFAGGKAAKMLVSGAIPIVGGAFSDAYTVIASGVELVKSGVGAFGLLASLAIFLPLCLEIAAWLLVCFCAQLAAEAMSLKPMASFLESCGSALRLLIAAVCSAGAVSVVSAAVMLCVRGAYA